MEEAGKRFAEALGEFTVEDTRTPFVNNVGARVISGSEEIRTSLLRQLSLSVLWEDCVKTMASLNIGGFIEVGFGRVLSGLIKRIEPSARLGNVEDVETLNKSLADLRRVLR